MSFALDELTNEVWKDIDEYPGYQASSLGRIRSWWDNSHQLIKEPHIMTMIEDKDGYYRVHLHADKKSKTIVAHRIIAKTFIPNPKNKPQVNHINGIKKDNRVDNLEWCTLSENRQHAYDTGLQKPPGEKAVRIIETGEVFRSLASCAKSIDGDESGIRACLSGKRHTHKDLHFELADKKEVNVKAKPFLYPHQEEAIPKMFNGCILNGGTGSGKSRTGLYYYFAKNGGSIKDQVYTPMKSKPPDLYILTTAKKRNDMEWEQEMIPFLLSTNPERNKYYGNKIVVDSWQNIKKYVDVTGAQFIFDENKISGKGTWAKSFIKIAKNNEWIILSATNADRWEDYATVFIAHGFFRNRTDFSNEHLVYSKYAKFPKVDGYRNERRLVRLRDKLLIDMEFERHTHQNHTPVYCKYDVTKYKEVIRNRWDPFRNEPIQQAAGLCYVLRKIVNSDESRQVALLELLEDHPKAIIFYNFDYELDILLNLGYSEGTKVAQYNGHRHDKLPSGNKWVYLVNYVAGCEAWNTTDTDTIIFFSQNYSYKVITQASGRIDRLTTKFNELYYYHLKTRSGIDLAISKALEQKKKFNERKFAGWDN